MASAVLRWAVDKVFLPATCRIEFSAAAYHAVVLAGNSAVQLSRDLDFPPSVVPYDATEANWPSQMVMESAVAERTLVPADLVIIHLLHEAVLREVIPPLREAHQRAARASGKDADEEVALARRTLESAIAGVNVLAAADLLTDGETLFERLHQLPAVEAAEWLQALNRCPGAELVIPWIVFGAVEASRKSTENITRMKTAIARIAAVGEALVTGDDEGYGVDVAGQLLTSFVRVHTPEEANTSGDGLTRQRRTHWEAFAYEEEAPVGVEEGSVRSVPRWLVRALQKASEIRDRATSCSRREERFVRRAAQACRTLLASPPTTVQHWHWLIVRCLEGMLTPAGRRNFPPGAGVTMEDLIARIRQTREDFAGNKEATELLGKCAHVLEKAKANDSKEGTDAPILSLGSIPTDLDSYLQHTLGPEGESWKMPEEEIAKPHLPEPAPRTPTAAEPSPRPERQAVEGGASVLPKPTDKRITLNAPQNRPGKKDPAKGNTGKRKRDQRRHF